ncbi:MAG TPA: Crp/Fnr family transcriptional regulator [Xanthobacteraceae bacterium]|nr:Crp/Fnr family transcriptional regulator [Xanthobacteraceae bacterium]
MHGIVPAIARTRCEDPFLARLARYVALSPQEAESLHALIEAEATVKKRRDLVVDGYEYRKLCFVKSGFGARYKLLRNGKRQIVNVVLPGDVVGLPGSFLDCAAFSVVAVSEMKLQVCALDAFVALCCRTPKFGLALSWFAVQEATGYAERVVDIGRRTSMERLARFLLEVHSRLVTVGLADPSSFELPFSQELMSDALGLSVPHLNRTFARLKSEGLIVVSDRHVVFADIEGLRLLAHFQPLELAPVPIPAASLAN